MNGRFSRLEFGERALPANNAEMDAKASPGTPARGAEYFLAQAEAACRGGLWEPALQHYTRTLHEDRSRVPAWVGQVQMLVELGEYAEARMWSDKALELFRGHGELLAAKARACCRHGDRAAAIAASDSSLKAPGTSPLRWVSRGEVLLEQRERRASVCFERALAEPGATWFDRVVIARVYLFHHQPAPADRYARSAVELHAGEPYAWVVLARCGHELGNPRQAEASCRRAMELAPGHPAATELLRAIAEDRSTPAVFRRLKGWLRP